MEKPGHTRKAIRFPLEIPIVFWWTDNGIENRSEGRSRDISERGAFVLASTCPLPGTQIGFRFLLPMITGLQLQTQVEALGRVLRVEKENEGEGFKGFAVLTQLELLRVKNYTSDVNKSGVISCE